MKGVDAVAKILQLEGVEYLFSYPAHPLIDDLKRKGFSVFAPLADAELCSPRLPQLLASHFKSMAPLVDYLCAALDLPF